MLRCLPRVGHAAAGIDEEVRLEVGLLLVLLDVVAVGLAEGAPVDVADLVAGVILAVLGELDAEALVRALVDAGEEALDEAAGDQRQAAVLGERGRVEVDRGGIAIIGREMRVRDLPRRRYALSGSRLRTSVAGGSRLLFLRQRDRLEQPVDDRRRCVMPSASALKVVTRRCRSTGWATARMSSVVTCSRPCRIARALPPRIRYWLARGPAPQATSSRHELRHARLLAAGSPGPGRRRRRTRGRPPTTWRTTSCSCRICSPSSIGCSSACAVLGGPLHDLELLVAARVADA